MRREISILRRLVFITLILFLVSACGGGQQDGGQKTVKRPENIPKNAAWVGGADGGVYIVVTKPRDVPPDIYETEIYHENGDLWYSGRMSIRPEGSGAYDISDAKTLSGWDGDTIYLTDGRRLIAIDPVGQ